MSIANQGIVKDKLDFLTEEAQVEQLADALLVGTAHNTEDEVTIAAVHLFNDNFPICSPHA